MMSLFKGFNAADLAGATPRLLCAMLADQLVLSNRAIEAQSEELKLMKKEIIQLQNKDGLWCHTHTSPFEGYNKK